MEEQKEMIAPEKTKLDLSGASTQVWLFKLSDEIKSEWFGQDSKDCDLGEIEEVNGETIYRPNPKFKKIPKMIKINFTSIDKNKLDNQLKVFSIDDKGKYKAEGKILRKGIIGGIGKDVISSQNDEFMRKYIDEKIRIEKELIQNKKNRNYISKIQIMFHIKNKNLNLVI